MAKVELVVLVANSGECGFEGSEPGNRDSQAIRVDMYCIGQLPPSDGRGTHAAAQSKVASMRGLSARPLGVS